MRFVLKPCVTVSEAQLNYTWIYVLPCPWSLSTMDVSLPKFRCSDPMLYKEVNRYCAVEQSADISRENKQEHAERPEMRAKPATNSLEWKPFPQHPFSPKYWPPNGFVNKQYWSWRMFYICFLQCDCFCFRFGSIHAKVDKMMTESESDVDILKSRFDVLFDMIKQSHVLFLILF